MRTPSSLFRQRAQYAAPGEDHGDGPQAGQPRPLRCRIDWGYRRYAGPQGTDVTVEGVLLCRWDEDVRPGGTLTLPSVAQEEAVRTVFSVNPAYGPTGRVRHLEVTFK